MDTYFGPKPTTPKLINLVREREIKDSVARTLSTKRNVTKDLVCRLGLEKELNGHQGCVNCLEWSDSGEILASASDDMHIFLWNPFSYKKLCAFNTGHNGNIFSVNFMPKSNNNIVVSGAGDAKVKVFHLKLSQVFYDCACHTGRVKRIATAENMPYLFWSAAEDGLVLQHDLRTPHVCVTGRKTVLVDLVYHMGRSAEAKCMAINAMRPELVAVGANDPYIRMFDRRMIKLSQPPVGTFSTTEVAEQPQGDTSSSAKGDSDDNDNIPYDCAHFFCPGHLRSKHQTGRSFTATYVTFSSDGNDLLANMGGEQIYLFDILKPRYNRLFDVPPVQTQTFYEVEGERHQLISSAYGTDAKNLKDYRSMNVKVLPHHVQELKLEANNKFLLDNYAAAINLYNKALGFCPMASVLYGNRAAALMKRGWDGDTYAALRDCQTTLLLDPEHVKAHFRLARCLFDLNRPHEAYKVIEDFQVKFPDYMSNAAHRALKKDITKAVRRDMSNRSYEDGQTLSPYEEEWRSQTIDYKMRYCGHCNTTTDIKEANFFGSDGQYILGGSDDGNIFIWDRYTTNIIRILRGDTRIVNCLQPHPSSCLLATSGIDPVIRLWSPLPEDEKPNARKISNTENVAQRNQVRMYSDPVALMMMNMGYQLTEGLHRHDDETDGETDGDNQNGPVVFHRTCRPS